MPDQTSSQVRQEHKLSLIYHWIFLVIITIYFTGALLFADPFHFWEHALSEIGTTRTLLGTPNLPSALDRHDWYVYHRQIAYRGCQGA